MDIQKKKIIWTYYNSSLFCQESSTLKHVPSNRRDLLIPQQGATSQKNRILFCLF